MKRIITVLLLTLMICSKSFAVDITVQLLKLEGMYERGSITEQEFLKAKSILLEIDVTTSKKIEKNIKKAKEQEVKVLQEEPIKPQEQEVKVLQEEPIEPQELDFKVRQFASSGAKSFEKMEMIFGDYRIYTHRPGGIKIRRLSDGQQLVVLSDDFKIKYYNDGEGIFNFVRYEETPEKETQKDSDKENEKGLKKLLSVFNKQKKQLDDILKIKKQKEFEKVTMELNGVEVLNWEGKYVKQHRAHFLQMLVLGEQPFHFYIVVSGGKAVALNMAQFTKKINIAVGKVKIKLAKKYNTTPEEIDRIIKKRKNRAKKQIAGMVDEAETKIEQETSDVQVAALSEAVDKTLSTSVDETLAKELEATIGEAVAKEFVDSIEQASGEAISEAVESEVADILDEAMAAAAEEGISQAAAQAAMEAGLAVIAAGGTWEEARDAACVAGGEEKGCD